MGEALDGHGSLARVGLASFLKRPDEGCGFYFRLVAEDRLFDRVAAGVVDLGLAESFAGGEEGFPGKAALERAENIFDEPLPCRFIG